MEELQKEPKCGSKCYNVPNIILLTADTYVVVDLYKELIKKFKDTRKMKYDVQIQKLFSKHIKPDEQHTLLNQAHRNKSKDVLNIYVGMPNRVKKLALKESFKLDKSDDRYRYLVIDCRLN